MPIKYDDFFYGRISFCSFDFLFDFFVLFRDWPSFQKTENIARYSVKPGGTCKKTTTKEEEKYRMLAAEREKMLRNQCREGL